MSSYIAVLPCGALSGAAVLSDTAAQPCGAISGAAVPSYTAVPPCQSTGKEMWKSNFLSKKNEGSQKNHLEMGLQEIE